MNNKCNRCNRNMSKCQKCTMANQTCDSCKIDRSSSCDNDCDYSKFDTTLKREKEMCGCHRAYTAVSNDNDYSCGCPLSTQKMVKSVSNNECAPCFAQEVDDLPVGMGYVPYQEWSDNVSNACQGLYDGTIFPELVKPFMCTFCYGERSNG